MQGRILIASIACTGAGLSMAATAPQQDSDYAANLYLKLASEWTGMETSAIDRGEGWVYDEALRLYVREAQTTAHIAPDPEARARTLAQMRSGGVLLIPNSTDKLLMTFEPDTGDQIDPAFIVLDPVETGTAIHAILGPSDNILISDQTRHVVHQYDFDGNYLGVFAPAGGADTSIMQNIRGISLRDNGNLLVTVAAGGNANSIAEFDTSGNFIGNFVAAGSGGLNSPFDIYERVGGDWLTSSINSNQILRYSETGAPLGLFATISSFPQQILELENGNVLVSNFSGTPGVHEFTADGTLISVHSPAGVTGNRGVFELGNGNILTTSSGGVFEIDRNGNLVSTKHTGQSRFIELVVLEPGPSCPGDVTGDGVVDLADLNLVLANFGETTDQGDATGDGVVDLADLNLVLANFGTDCNKPGS
jgi:hypothetical protein